MLVGQDRVPRGLAITECHAHQPVDQPAQPPIGRPHPVIGVVPGPHDEPDARQPARQDPEIGAVREIRLQDVDTLLLEEPPELPELLHGSRADDLMDIQPDRGAIGRLQRPRDVVVAVEQAEVRLHLGPVEMADEGQELGLGPGGRKAIDQETHADGRVGSGAGGPERSTVPAESVGIVAGMGGNRFIVVWLRPGAGGTPTPSFDDARTGVRQTDGRSGSLAPRM